MKNIEIEFLTSKHNDDEKSEYIGGHFALHKKVDDKEFLKFLYWVWLSKRKNVKDFYYEDYIYDKFPVITYKENEKEIYFPGSYFEIKWDEYNKNTVKRILESQEILNNLYQEYLKNKDSFDFFSPLLKKAKQGNTFAFMGLINLDKVEMVETKHSPTDYRKKDIIYKLPNGEYVKKHFGIEIDPWEDSSYEEEYVEFSFVEPVEKTIIEWKEKKK